MKKHDNMFQIGEAASICGITRRMLLNYEDLGLVIPACVDHNSGYRYYDLMNISRIQMILDLRQAGMSLPDIKTYLNGDLSVNSKIATLEEQRRLLEKNIQNLKLRTGELESQTIHMISFPETTCLCSEYIAETIADGIKAYCLAYAECIRRGIPFALCSYHFCEFPEDIFSENFFKTEFITMRICISVDKAFAPEDAITFPKCSALSLVYSGEYENIYSAYDKLIAYIQDNGYIVAGYPRELYMEGFFDHKQKLPVTQIIIPVKSQQEEHSF